VKTRRLALVTLLVVVVAALPPALIGVELRAMLSPWLSGPVAMVNAGAVRVRLTDDSWFSTRVAITLEGGPTSGAGELSFEHSPVTWATGIKTTTTSHWPGYVVGHGRIEIDGSMLGGLFTPLPESAPITAELSAGAPARVNGAVKIPAGFLRVRGARIELTHATLMLKANLLESGQLMPFIAQLGTAKGALNANGKLDPANGRWQLTALFDPDLAQHVMTALLLAELSAQGHRQPDTKALATLSARRVRALVMLGYLQERDGQLFTEAALGENGFEVFGEPVALSLPAANLGKQQTSANSQK
jgi:hypothetical protein